MTIRCIFCKNICAIIVIIITFLQIDLIVHVTLILSIINWCDI